jgi:hypothetical protein
LQRGAAAVIETGHAGDGRVGEHRVSRKAQIFERGVLDLERRCGGAITATAFADASRRIDGELGLFQAPDIGALDKAKQMFGVDLLAFARLGQSNSGDAGERASKRKQTDHEADSGRCVSSVLRFQR